MAGMSGTGGILSAANTASSIAIDMLKQSQNLALSVNAQLIQSTVSEMQTIAGLGGNINTHA